MNSTDQARLAAFYHQHLVVLAERLRERQVEFFPLGPESDKDTWYVDFPDDEPDLLEIDPRQHASLLTEMWEKQGLPELASLARVFIELGSSLTVEVEQTADVSPTIYVMH